MCSKSDNFRHLETFRDVKTKPCFSDRDTAESKGLNSRSWHDFGTFETFELITQQNSGILETVGSHDTEMSKKCEKNCHFDPHDRI